MICWKCKKEFLRDEKIVRTSTCPYCSADLHVCKACAFYEVGAHYDCHETIDECVTDKVRGNFCEYFSPSKTLSAKENDENEKQKSARVAFDALFS